jgi:SAM-dependent methyltransferase
MLGHRAERKRRSGTSMMDEPKPRWQVEQVEHYRTYRPSYPRAIVELLQRECALTAQACIADIGAGTGMLTELFLEHGHRVYGVEPDPSMRAAAEDAFRAYPTFTSIAATAEATTLPDRSIDFITAAQAFHWFDRKHARVEFARILVPRGWVVLVWNLQRTGGTPFLDAWEQFWQTYMTREGVQGLATGQELTRLLLQTNPDYRRRLDPELAAQELIVPFFGAGRFARKTFANPQVYDLEQLKGRVRSSVIAAQPGHPRYAEMLDALEAIFQMYQVEGRVTIEHDTEVWYGQLD